MACKLYYKYGKNDFYIGQFPNREKAESHWHLIRTKLESELGFLTPIYVETGKGRGK